MALSEKRQEFCGYGTTFTAKRWFTWNVGGIAGLLFSYSIHLYALLVLFHQVVLPLSSSSTMISIWSNLLFYIIYVPLALLAIISLFVASTTNPGAVPMGAKPFITVRRLASSDSDSAHLSSVVPSSTTTIRRCYKCQDNYKPARAHHDSVTDRCIVKFDHYCPWINNAVGALNHKFFCLFLLYTMLSCLVSGILIVLRYEQCFALHPPDNADDSVIPVNPHGSNAEYHTEGDRTLDHGSSSNNVETETLRLVNACTAAFWNNHYILLLMLASLLFFFFTLVMGYEQLEAIETGKGKIARMKQSVGHQGTEFSKVTEEFNEMFGGSTPHVAWHWFLPISLRFPRGMQQVVLGYEYDNHESGTGPFQPTTNVEGARDGDNDATTDVEMGLVHSSSSNDESPDASTEDRSARPLLRSALSREGSSDSSSHSQIKNRKGNSSHTEVEDGSLVERTRARLT